MNASFPTKNDFADWLSPMLVKELRQAVRSRLFVSMFIMLQVAMLLTMMAGLLTTGDGLATGSTVAFWVTVGIFVLVVLPMSGFNAVGGEIKANTLELIFLTRLSSLRIIAGKWLAIFVASVLLVTAVLPYLVLRYFMGGVNITTEMIALFSMLAASAWLTAITVGMSSYQTRAARWVMGFVVFFVLQGSAPFFFISGMSSVGGFGVRSYWQVACLIATGVISLLMMLDAGASRIAPAAENHSAIQRVLALGLLALAGLANWLPGDARTVTMVAFALTLLVCIAALCEQPRWIGSIYRPFAARGVPGRLLGRLLYPGWHTGVWYTTVVFAGFSGLLVHLKMLDSNSSAIRLVAVVGTLLLPVALCRLFFPKTRRPLAIFFAVQVVCLILLIASSIVDETLKASSGRLIAFLPLCALIQSFNGHETRSVTAVAGVPLVTAASWAALVILGRAPMKQTRELENDSLQTALPDGSLA